MRLVVVYTIIFRLAVPVSMDKTASRREECSFAFLSDQKTGYVLTLKRDTSYKQKDALFESPDTMHFLACLGMFRLVVGLSQTERCTTKDLGGKVAVHEWACSQLPIETWTRHHQQTDFSNR